MTTGNINLDSGPQAVLIDVTDPANMKVLGKTPQRTLQTDAVPAGAATTSTHTVQCVNQLDCQYAYTAGTGSMFSILDLTDLTKPVQLKTVPSPASGPGGSGFARGAGHYWDFDGVLGWHTGSGGAAAFDVSDPKNPLIVDATNAQGRAKGLNDFIQHNSMRPNAARFVPGAPPSIANGNVLLVTEEDYFNKGPELACQNAGSFQTWYIPDLDGTAYRLKNPDGKKQDVGNISNLDSVNAPFKFGGGATLPVAAFCSAHWFDVQQDGFVAQGWYQGGLRILDVRDARQIKQFGYSTGVLTEVWDAYWVPKRDANGVVIPGQKTNIVYTADAVRGVEVYEVDLTAPPAGGGTAPTASASPSPTPSPGGDAPTSPRVATRSLAATGPTPWLSALALALLTAVAVRWRRRASGSGT